MEKDSNGRSPKLAQASLLASGSLYSLISCNSHPLCKLVASGTGHQVFPAWDRGTCSSPMHLGCCMAALVGPTVLEPFSLPWLRGQASAGTSCPQLFCCSLKALPGPRSPACCFVCGDGKCHPSTVRVRQRHLLGRLSPALENEDGAASPPPAPLVPGHVSAPPSPVGNGEAVATGLELSACAGLRHGDASLLGNLREIKFSTWLAWVTWLCSADLFLHYFFWPITDCKLVLSV